MDQIKDLISSLDIRIRLAIPLAVFAVIMAVSVVMGREDGEVNFVFDIDSDCLEYDPARGEHPLDTLHPNDEIDGIVFVKNICDNRMHVDLKVDGPNVPYIEAGSISGTGLHCILPGDTTKIRWFANISNDAPTSEGHKIRVVSSLPEEGC